MSRRRLALLILLPAVVPLFAGCESIAYYRQAIGGQLEILSAARPVDAWLADPSTPPDLRARLDLARRIREFASRELALPDNKSYTSYADLGRRFVVWNVFAAPEFSVASKKECFPFTGCVSYRGFFSEEDARRHAERLRAEGFDVYVGGVPAYSTLGWFDDPLLSTFIRYPDAQLARLVFHELSHQLVYAADDTMFNESFAVSVEQEGVRRWLKAEGREQELQAFDALERRRQQFSLRVKEASARLKEVYRQGLPDDEMRRRKAEEFDLLRKDYPNAIPAEPNNAFLVSVALYTELVPEFDALLRESGSLEAFYARVRDLAKAGGFRKLKPPGPAASSPAR
jgi:predicted aminopeptidase